MNRAEFAKRTPVQNISDMRVKLEKLSANFKQRTGQTGSDGVAFTERMLSCCEEMITCCEVIQFQIEQSN